MENELTHSSLPMTHDKTRQAMLSDAGLGSDLPPGHRLVFDGGNILVPKGIPTLWIVRTSRVCFFIVEECIQVPGQNVRVGWDRLKA